MRMRAVSFCLTFVLAVAVLMLGGSKCEASTFIKVQVKLDKNANPPEIDVKELGNRFVGVCKTYAATKKQCRGDEFEWKLVVQGGQLNSGEEVKILNAPNHLPCFAVSSPLYTWNSGNANTKYESGEPSEVCAQDKYGTFWPYVVEYWKNGVRKATSDPGGIIFP